MRTIAGLFALLLFVGTASAQVHVQINISSQPIWGPVGYDYVEYYYLPDLDVYYYVPGHQFVYLERGRWLRAAVLPARFGRVDLYGMYKVVVNERTPYLHHKMFVEKYRMYKGRHDQRVIRDSRDQKYYVIKGHPEHNRWVKENKGRQGNNGNGRGNAKGNGKGNGKGKRGNGRNR